MASRWSRWPPDFRESLPLKLGDKLTFDIAGETIEATISSFRDVQWDSMQPNFFLMFAPGLLDGAAGTWMGSAVYRPGMSRPRGRGRAAFSRRLHQQGN